MEDIKEFIDGFAQKQGEAINTAVEKKFLEADGEIKKLNAIVERQGLELAKARTSTSREFKTTKDILLEKKAELENLSDTGDKSARVRIKVPVNKDLINRATVQDNRMGYRLPAIGELATRGLVLRTLFEEVQLSEEEISQSGGVIRYIDQATQLRNAAPVAEGAAKPEGAATWIDRVEPLQVISQHVPVTKQAYRHLGFMAGEIDRMLQRNLAITFDQQLWNGSGTAPNLRGVYNANGIIDVNADLPSLPLAAGIDNPNLYDLVASVRTLIMNGRQQKYNVNVAVMNPVDTLRFKVAKALDQHYILPPFVSADGMRIDQVLVVESSAVDANTMVIGDFSFGTIYVSENATVDMGYITDQFIRNQWTIRAELEALLLIRNVDANAFARVTNIANAVASLARP